jgi:hypothetical protein
VFYRLLREPPLTVCFPSIVYAIEWSEDRQCRHLMLCQLGSSGGYHIDSYQVNFTNQLLPDGKALRVDQVPKILSTGIDVLRPSIVDTVFARLVREGRAEITVGPHCQVYYRGSRGEVITVG